MCINNPVKVTTQSEIPEYGYKVMRRKTDGTLMTPYMMQRMKTGVWIEPRTKKIAHEAIARNWSHDYLNKGRISVFINLKDAKKQLRSDANEVWLVEIKSRTIFKGKWSGGDVMIVNKIKLVRRVAKVGLWRRFMAWL